MKKTFMALALTLLPFGMASAQVRMLVVPKDGTAPKSFNLDDIRRIDFLGEANTFSIACATDRWSYEFDKVRCLKFDGLVNDIATATKQESAVSIAYREGQIFVSVALVKSSVKVGQSSSWSKYCSRAASLAKELAWPAGMQAILYDLHSGVFVTARRMVSVRLPLEKLRNLTSAATRPSNLVK